MNQLNKAATQIDISFLPMPYADHSTTMFLGSNGKSCQRRTN